MLGKAKSSIGRVLADVRLRLWEITVAVGGALFAALFVFSNVSAIGFGLLGADALWVLTRVRMVETAGPPGRYGRRRGQLGLLKLVVLLGIYAAVLYGVVIVHHDRGERTRSGLIAVFALAGTSFLLLEELKRSGDDAVNWLIGSRAEREVGVRLDELKQRGYLVVHGYKKDRGGDIDHLVCGPSGAYAIETKSYGFRRADLGQPAGNAAWLKGKLNVRWVTAVLCVDGDLPPTQYGVIWVMGQQQLVQWLKRQRNIPVDPEEARAALFAAAPKRDKRQSFAKWRRIESTSNSSASEAQL